jgi:hypothetical protein
MLHEPNAPELARKLSVRYRASQSPQRLHIAYRLAAPSHSPHAAYVVNAMRCIGEGFGAGADFPPHEGRATQVSGPHPRDARQLLECAWDFEVASVSPRFLQLVTNALQGKVVQSIIIHGDAPLDDGPLSVDGSKLISWMLDEPNYPAPWKPIPFAHEIREVDDGATFRIRFASGIEDAHVAALEKHFDALIYFLSQFSNGRGGIGCAGAISGVARGGSEVTVRMQDFGVARGPSKAALLNMLHCFHVKVAPIQEALLLL